MYINDSSPHIILIGGGNGSGKTTIAMQLQEDTGVNYLGADAIAAQLDPAEYHNIETEAARVFSTESRLSSRLKPLSSLNRPCPG